VRNVLVAGSRVFFVGDSGSHGEELWRSDGTTAGTVEVHDLRPGPTGATPWGLSIVDGTLLFTADDGTGPSLWTSDGTAAGTVRIGSFPSDPTQVFSPFVAAGDDVYVSAYDSERGRELWAFPRQVLGGPCAGDCDVSRSVSIDELVVSVNIALGSVPVSRCGTADLDADGAVTVSELVTAVNHALEGCAAVAAAGH
jgi:ELWxxDGT repeat protein